MRASFTIEEPAVSNPSRAIFLIVGLLLFGLGLLGVFRLAGILLGLQPWPTHPGMGGLITISALGLGCAFVWGFFIPSKTVVIDAAAQVVRFAYRYPFGISRNDTFALEEVSPPEMVWHRNSEYADGGFWKLKLTLPDGRSVSRCPDSPNLTQQKKQIEGWQAEIQALRR